MTHALQSTTGTTAPTGGATERADADRVRPFGAEVVATGTRFSLYADPGRSCLVRIFDDNQHPIADHPLAATATAGEYAATVPDLGPGALYKFVVDGQELPDPYARWLPFGVHGPAMVIAARYPWQNGPGVARPLREQVIYELHVGAFTPEGTFAAARGRLGELADLGITTIELMPLSSFPGARGWGYDGVAHFAPFAPYGRPEDLRAFVDEAHRFGLSVLLDVVYNHFGPAGNYLRCFSEHYFNAEVSNAWGDGPNYGHPAMRRYVISNALYWLNEFRFDGLRLDATHAMVDKSPTHILRELAERVHALEPRRVLIAEDDRNDPGLVSDTGLDALWADDFHHVVHVTLTGERDGYYAAYPGGAAAVAETIDRGWRYVGQVYPPSGKRRGQPATELRAESFVYCIENHDQIGNRALGERLSALVSLDAYCAVSTLLLYLPMTPLIFMGGEWAASTPFLYFTDHDPELGAAISQGRRNEFSGFAAFSDPARRAAVPDPQSEATFVRSRLRWEERGSGPHQRVLALTRQLLAFRATDPVMTQTGRPELEATSLGDLLIVRRAGPSGERQLLLNFGRAPAAITGLPRVSSSPAILLASKPGLSSGATSIPAETAIIVASRDSA